MVIGAQSGSQGTYNLGNSSTGATSLEVFGSIIIGRDAGSNAGTTPGANSVNANLVLQGNSSGLASFGVFYTAVADRIR